MVTLAAGVAFKRFAPRAPYMLLAMVVGSVLALALNQVLGPLATNIQSVAAIPAVLPPLSTPVFAFDAFKSLVPAAAAMTLFALTAAVTIARSLAIPAAPRPWYWW